MSTIDSRSHYIDGLVAAEQVRGTNVYNTEGEKLGSVADIMIDKSSGRAIYAVMSFGGFLGIGEIQHPLPWSTLHYDVEKGGYVVRLSREQLEAAPMFDQTADFKWSREFGQEVDRYYDAPSDWH